MEKKLAEKLEPTMLDPSLLCVVDFWEEISNLRRIFRAVYFPESIKRMTNTELREFYGGYLSEERILGVGKVANRCQERFRSFSWEEYSGEMSDQFSVGFGNLRSGLDRSYITKSIQNVLLDEFVFLATQSSILSRMKKVFRLFEKFDAIPLLNLEKRSPDEWKKSVRGAKKATKLANWIGSICWFSLVLGPVAGPIVGSTVTGVRLLLVDPPPS